MYEFCCDVTIVNDMSISIVKKFRLKLAIKACSLSNKLYSLLIATNFDPFSNTLNHKQYISFPACTLVAKLYFFTAFARLNRKRK